MGVSFFLIFQCKQFREITWVNGLVKWLDHDQNHDSKHPQYRHFIEPAIPDMGARIFTALELAQQAFTEVVVANQYEYQSDFEVHPRTVFTDAVIQPQNQT
jgi:hypothetical protein